MDTVKVGPRNYFAEAALGKGAFGEVYKVRENEGTGCVYALKKIEVENNEAVNMVRKEIGILDKCRHDHIVRLYGYDTIEIPVKTSVLILMEYCEGGNLNSRLARQSDSRETNLRWMKELADAMDYLHSNKIVHRDLKPENVLLTAQDSIKLGDFGLAREYAALKQVNAKRSNNQVLKSQSTYYMETIAGSPYWMAPEVFDEHYTKKADIFSLGTIFHSIVKRVYITRDGIKYFGAFVNTTRVGQEIGLGMALRTNPYDMVRLDRLPNSTKELLRTMLAYDPKNRPTAKRVLQKLQP